MDALLSEGDPNVLFELIEELAVGSYGTVYKVSISSRAPHADASEAIHGPTGDTVALKIIKIEEDDTLDAMVDEVRIMKLCTHPNIVKFYGAWKTPEELFVRLLLNTDSAPCLPCTRLPWSSAVAALFSIYIRVREFAYLFDSLIGIVLKKPLSEGQISLIARDTLSALDYMHDTLNIIHRDIKAANLLLTDEGKLKLSAFLSRSLFASP